MSDTICIRIFLKSDWEEITLFDDVIVNADATDEEIEKIVNEEVMNAQGIDDETFDLLQDHENWSVEWEVI